MYKWTKALSWSKVRQILSCPKKLEFSLNNTPEVNTTPSYYRVLGITTQYVLERYFVQAINRHPRGTDPEVIDKVVSKVLTSDWMKKHEITYPLNTTREDLEKEVRRHVIQGVELMRAKNFLTKEVGSEVKMVAKLRGVMAYAQVDFVVKDQRKYVILDGKSTQKAEEDERQILQYSAIFAASGAEVAEAGFLYWGLGKYKAVDVSPAAIQKFLSSDWMRVTEVAIPLREGVESLKARPGERCFKCNWKGVCPDSLYLKDKNMKPEGEVTL